VSPGKEPRENNDGQGEKGKDLKRFFEQRFASVTTRQFDKAGITEGGAGGSVKSKKSVVLGVRVLRREGIGEKEKKS